MIRSPLAACALAAWLILGASAAAQQAPPTSDTPQTDVWDWLKRRKKQDGAAKPADAEQERRRTAVLFVPILGSKPSTGLVFGAGASIEFPLGDPNGGTYMSSVLTGASVSTKKQYSISGRLSLFGPGNDWAFVGDNHYQQKGQETYGFGTDTTDTDRVDAKFNSIRFVDTFLRRLPGDFYAGLGFLYQRQQGIGPVDKGAPNWNSSPYVEYSQRFGFDLSAQTSAGLGLSLRHDRRDSVSDPARGSYVDATYRAYLSGFLGGASTWQALSFDARAYRTLTGNRRRTLAAWGYGEFITGGTAPYFALPATGMDPQGRTGRGYAEGRFRGDRLLYGEIEYRVSLRRDGLVGMVAFLNATSVGSTFDDDHLFDSVAVGAGFGFRLRLDKRSRTNLGLDFGFGRHGSRGVYIALAEAF